jgi:hypothetical protein
MESSGFTRCLPIDIIAECDLVIMTGLKPIGPIALNYALAVVFFYRLFKDTQQHTAVISESSNRDRQHTTTHCSYFREQQ